MVGKRSADQWESECNKNSWGEPIVYRRCRPVVDVEYDFEGDSSATEAIIWALADAVGVDPVDLPPLFESIDPDALTALFSRYDKDTDGYTLLSFQVDTWNVFVRSDGRICVCDATQPTDPEPVFDFVTP